MENIIKMLDALMESGDFTATRFDEDGCTYLNGGATTDIDYAAADMFVTLNGQPDYEAIEQFEKLSNGRYRVTPGGTDMFEWVAGSIQTPVGVIIYG